MQLLAHYVLIKITPFCDVGTFHRQNRFFTDRVNYFLFPELSDLIYFIHLFLQNKKTNLSFFILLHMTQPNTHLWKLHNYIHFFYFC